jgi:hypothetical protein
VFSLQVIIGPSCSEAAGIVSSRVAPSGIVVIPYGALDSIYKSTANYPTILHLNMPVRGFVCVYVDVFVLCVSVCVRVRV